MRLVLFIILLLAGMPSHASSYAPSDRIFSGKAYVHDGDTIRINQQTIRLWGIDAVELKQTCNAVPCGEMARYTLVAIIGDRDVTCTEKGKSYRRVVALCVVEGRDIAALMVRAGMAFEEPRYSHGYYTADEMRAQQAHAGVWAMKTLSPKLWRICQRQEGCISREKFLAGFTPIRGRIMTFDTAYRLTYKPRVHQNGIRAVNRAVNVMPYQPDTESHQVFDANFFWKHGGDCDKFAIAKMLELRAQGVQGMAYLVLKSRLGKPAHAVLAVVEDGIMLALDNRFDEPVPLARIYKDYEPAYFIDADTGVLWRANGS